MQLHDLADIASVVGGAALFVSVLLLFLELRENNRLTKAANTQALVGLSSPFYMALIQDRKMAEMYVLGAARYAEMDEVERHRYKSLLFWWLILHENIYYQWRRGFLDYRSFKPWGEDLKLFVQLQKLELHWPTFKHLFQEPFADYVQQLIADAENASNATGDAVTGS